MRQISLDLLTKFFGFVNKTFSILMTGISASCLKLGKETTESQLLDKIM